MKMCSQIQAEWFRKRKWLLIAGALICVFAWLFFTTFAPVREYALWRFGPALPTVSRVEVISLGPQVEEVLRRHFPSEDTYRSRAYGGSGSDIFAYRRTTVRGERAAEIGRLWRSLEFSGHGALCHHPGYALKFYQGPLLVLETTVCWSCDNLVLPVQGKPQFVGFTAYSPPAQDLLRLLQKTAPLPLPDSYNYTNAPISVSEVSGRVRQAVTNQFDSDFREYALHSPQLGVFRAELLGILAHPDGDVRRAALIHALALKAELSEGQRLRVLQDQGSGVNATYLSHLYHSKQRVALPVEPLLPMLQHHQVDTRNHALHLLLEPDALSDNQAERMLTGAMEARAKFGTNCFYFQESRKILFSIENVARLTPLLLFLGTNSPGRFERVVQLRISPSN